MRSAVRSFAALFARSATVTLATLMLFAGLSAISSGAKAETPAVSAVLELFTSQGCSSCPPADRLFESYAGRKDIVALTLPVDYWDYLGWKDTLASRRYSDRQRMYAKSRGDGAVYTPQIVVNGRSHAVGSRKGTIDELIRESAGSPSSALPVALNVSKKGESLLIDIGARPAALTGGPETVTVWLAAIRRKTDVAVQRGENSGETLTYYNVVRSLTPVGMWSGDAVTLQVPDHTMHTKDAETCAVLLQQGIGGPIIGAAWLKH